MEPFPTYRKVLTVSPSATASPSPSTSVVTVVDFGRSTSELHEAVRLLPTSPLKETSDSSPFSGASGDDWDFVSGSSAPLDESLPQPASAGRRRAAHRAATGR